MSVLKKYNAKELKAFLKSKKLLTQGNKGDLVNRAFKAIMHPEQLTEQDKPKKKGKKKKPQQNENITNETTNTTNDTSLSEDEMDSGIKILSQKDPRLVTLFD